MNDKLSLVEPALHKPKSITVLEALYTGNEVEMDGYRWYLLDTESGGKALCIRSEVWENNAQKEDEFLCPDISLNHFITMCDKLSFEEVFILGCEGVLKREAAKKRR